MSAWVCPKCSRVWGPYVRECKPCNASVVPQTFTNPTHPIGWIPPIKRQRTEMIR